MDEQGQCNLPPRIPSPPRYGREWWISAARELRAVAADGWKRFSVWFRRWWWGLSLRRRQQLALAAGVGLVLIVPLLAAILLRLGNCASGPVRYPLELNSRGNDAARVAIQFVRSRLRRPDDADFELGDDKWTVTGEGDLYTAKSWVNIYGEFGRDISSRHSFTCRMRLDEKAGRWIFLDAEISPAP